MHYRRTNLTFAWLWSFSAVLLFSHHPRPVFGISAPRIPFLSRNNHENDNHELIDDGSSSKWKSFFNVDPSKILTTLIKRGGLLLPQSVEQELKQVAKMLHVDSAVLNLVEKELLLTNFTVNLPTQGDSLRVGRVDVKWDSYLKPCVDITVDNVEIWMEFLNLVLTRTNWHELQEAGFPPSLYYDYQKMPSSNSTFVRIGSLQLGGDVRVHIESRPLHRPIVKDLKWPMETLGGLYAKIQATSNANLASTGRRGCTTDELYDIVQDYFGERLKTFIKERVKDVAEVIQDVGMETAKTRTVDEARRIASSVGGVMKDYSEQAVQTTERNLEGSLAQKLTKMGIPSAGEKLAKLKELSRAAVETLEPEQIAQAQLQRLKDAVQSSIISTSASSAAQEPRTIQEVPKTLDPLPEKEHKKDEIIQEDTIQFADW